MAEVPSHEPVSPVPLFPNPPPGDLCRSQSAQLPHQGHPRRWGGLGCSKVSQLCGSSLVFSALRNAPKARFFPSVSQRFPIEHHFYPARWDGRTQTSSSPLAPRLFLCFPAGLHIKMSTRSSSSTSPSSYSLSPSPVGSSSTPGESGLVLGRDLPPESPCPFLPSWNVQS